MLKYTVNGTDREGAKDFAKLAERLTVTLLQSPSDAHTLFASYCVREGWMDLVKSALSYIVDMKPTGTSIPSLLEGSPEGAVGVHQPKLVCLGHPSTTAQYIIIAKNDKVAIPLQEKLHLRAFQ